MRKTKIVCTIGPASSDRAVFADMCRAGMNVARLNFSHGTHEEQKAKLDMIRSVREELGLPIAILLDTKGPEYRIRTFRNGKITLNDGDTFTFTTRDIEGDEGIVSVSYKGLAQEMHPGDKILVNNGLVIFEVLGVEGEDIHCRVEVGGELSNRKSMSFPNKVLKQTYLSEQDKADLLFGIENEVDFIAASFVSCKQDVLDLKDFLAANGGEKIDVIAKIENRAGVDNINEICEVCEGIMVARGDLGVEVPFTELPAIQKRLITTCRLLGKRVITATEMLESMIHNPRPTRAEISDVANAVYDGSSAVMLSGESAAGKYPVQSVATMAAIVSETEQHINYEKRFRKSDFKINSLLDAISHATCGMAIDIGAKCIVVSIPVRPDGADGLALPCAHGHHRYWPRTKKVWQKPALSWGVIPVLSEQFKSIRRPVLPCAACRPADAPAPRRRQGRHDRRHHRRHLRQYQPHQGRNHLTSGGPPYREGHCRSDASPVLHRTMQGRTTLSAPPRRSAQSPIPPERKFGGAPARRSPIGKREKNGIILRRRTVRDPSDPE